jgi:hypothetical protein
MATFSWLDAVASFGLLLFAISIWRLGVEAHLAEDPFRIAKLSVDQREMLRRMIIRRQIPAEPRLRKLAFQRAQFVVNVGRAAQVWTALVFVSGIAILNWLHSSPGVALVAFGLQAFLLLSGAWATLVAEFRLRRSREFVAVLSGEIL